MTAKVFELPGGSILVVAPNTVYRIVNRPPLAYAGPAGQELEWMRMQAHSVERAIADVSRPTAPLPETYSPHRVPVVADGKRTVPGRVIEAHERDMCVELTVQVEITSKQCGALVMGETMVRIEGL